MTIVRIDADSPVPPFEQLRVQLSALIRAGELAAGSNLPTVRQLAADLELAKNTVVRAYRSLEQEGLVSADRRHGTTVNELPKPTRTQRQRLIAEATRRYLAELVQLDANHDEALAAIKRLAPR
ncbi:MAG TPA: GntR family transcriptional regulator [Ilumatobacteraceae bacterium]|nr:GntR family transcriptional regulator [Ilumatobacteraceae bacterium]